MGNLEQNLRKRSKRKNLQRLILGTIAMAGLLPLALVAPNVLGAMAKLGLLPTGRQKESIREARNLLVRKGWLVRDKNGFLHLTKNGEHALLRMQIAEDGLKKPHRWDGKWRVLIFDIPEKRGALRIKLRRSLQAVGFVLLQDSVWIYPYECEDFIALLKTDLRIGKDVRYMVVEAIEADESYRKIFDLPLH